MPGLKFSNNASAQLASALTNVATTLSVATGTGALFPPLAVGEWFPLVVVNPSGEREVMRATARSGDVITVTRAQEGTSARAFDPGARVDLRITAAALADIIIDVGDAIEEATSDLESDLSGKLSARTGARLLMPQSTAEPMWQQITNINDRVLRVVSGPGGGQGGGWVISGLAVGNRTLSTGQMPAHNHPGVANAAGNHAHPSPQPNSTGAHADGSEGGTDNLWQGNSGNNTGNAGGHDHSLNISNTGGGGAHNHPLDADGAWRPAFWNVIAAAKQAA